MNCFLDKSSYFIHTLLHHSLLHIYEILIMFYFSHVTIYLIWLFIDGHLSPVFSYYRGRGGLVELEAYKIGKG